jgi:hypothetical protein
MALHFEPQQLLNFVLDSDLAFDFETDAEPYQAFELKRILFRNNSFLNAEKAVTFVLKTASTIRGQSGQKSP